MSRGGVLKGTYNLIMEVNMHKQKTIKGQKRKRDAELELSLGFPKWLPALAFQDGSLPWLSKMAPGIWKY